MLIVSTLDVDVELSISFSFENSCSEISFPSISVTVLGTSFEPKSSKDKILPPYKWIVDSIFALSKGSG
jgi:hypothetical protein